MTSFSIPIEIAILFHFHNTNTANCCKKNLSNERDLFLQGKFTYISTNLWMKETPKISMSKAKKIKIRIPIQELALSPLRHIVGAIRNLGICKLIACRIFWGFPNFIFRFSFVNLLNSFYSNSFLFLHFFALTPSFLTLQKESKRSSIYLCT